MDAEGGTHTRRCVQSQRGAGGAAPSPCTAGRADAPEREVPRQRCARDQRRARLDRADLPQVHALAPPAAGELQGRLRALGLRAARRHVARGVEVPGLPERVRFVLPGRCCRPEEERCLIGRFPQRALGADRGDHGNAELLHKVAQVHGTARRYAASEGARAGEPLPSADCGPRRQPGFACTGLCVSASKEGAAMRGHARAREALAGSMPASAATTLPPSNVPT
mmetsp:Transcript_87610/g.271270  ORF Transcript_87610/g.271270 Transcript_87610/m.271270 type:complete len:224 (-) Transcript_87610:92-763(-)